MVPWSVLKLGLIGWWWLKLVLIGWLVARTHRAQAAAMVLIFATSRILYVSTSYMNHYLVSGTYGGAFLATLLQNFIFFMNPPPPILLICLSGRPLAPNRPHTTPPRLRLHTP